MMLLHWFLAVALQDSLEDLWGQLDSSDRSLARLAISSLAARGDEAVVFLKNRLVLSLPTEAQVKEWIEQLDSDLPAARDEAMEKLQEAGVAEPLLLQALDKTRSPESRERLARLQQLQDRPPYTDPRRTRRLYALRALRKIDSPGARDVMAQLAARSPSKFEREEATRGIPGPQFLTAEGKRAYDDLTQLYVSKKEINYREVLARLDQAEHRRRAAAYLLALIVQSLDDEFSGRNPWIFPEEDCNDRPPNLADDLRLALVEGLFNPNRIEWEPEIVEIYSFLFDHEESDDVFGAAMNPNALSRMPLSLFKRALGGPHPNRIVLERLIAEAKEQSLDELVPEIQALLHHPERRVRLEAREAVSKLTGKAPAEQPPRLTPLIERQLKQIADLMPIPPGAAFCSITRSSEIFFGWVIDNPQADSYKILASSGGSHEFARRECKLEPAKLLDPAANQEIGTLPGLMAAWCFIRGESSSALEWLDSMNVGDDRAILSETLDVLAYRLHNRMVEAFWSRRDYSEALLYARTLSSPAFDGRLAHGYAKTLVGQLSQQREDFKDFTLPTPAQWDKIRLSSTREQAVNYLAGRLRLASNDGDLLRDPLPAEKPESWRSQVWPRVTPVINPGLELLRMNLKGSELMHLAPCLQDPKLTHTTHMPAGTRYLYRVKRLTRLVLASVFGDAPMLNSVDAFHAWCRQNPETTVEDVLVENLRRCEEENAFKGWIETAERLNFGRTARPLIDAQAKFPTLRQEIVKACYGLKTPDVVAEATNWSKDVHADVRMYGALLLLEFKQQGREILEDLFKDKYQSASILGCIADSEQEQLRDLIRWGLRRHSYKGAHLRTLWLLYKKGYPEARDALLAGLDSTDGSRVEHVRLQGRTVQRVRGDSDVLAGYICGELDGCSYDSFAEDQERKAQREAIKRRLIEDFKKD